MPLTRKNSDVPTSSGSVDDLELAQADLAARPVAGDRHHGVVEGLLAMPPATKARACRGRSTAPPWCRPGSPQRWPRRSSPPKVKMTGMVRSLTAASSTSAVTVTLPSSWWFWRMTRARCGRRRRDGALARHRCRAPSGRGPSPSRHGIAPCGPCSCRRRGCWRRSTGSGKAGARRAHAPPSPRDEAEHDLVLAGADDVADVEAVAEEAWSRSARRRSR